MNVFSQKHETWHGLYSLGSNFSEAILPILHHISKVWESDLTKTYTNVMRCVLYRTVWQSLYRLCCLLCSRGYFISCHCEIVTKGWLLTSGMAAGSAMVDMTSLMRSMGMSPTTLGLLFSSWGRGSDGLRFSPTRVHGHRGRWSTSLHGSFFFFTSWALYLNPPHQVSLLRVSSPVVGRTDLLSVCWEQLWQYFTSVSRPDFK